MKKVMFIGCGGLLVFIILVAAFMYWGMNALTSRFVESFTSEQPVTLPKSALTPEEQTSLEQKLESFQKSMNAGQEGVLELDKEEFNHWLQMITSEPLEKFPDLPEWKEMVYADFTNNLIVAHLSIPLDSLKEIVFLKAAQGRYFNGIAKFKPQKIGANQPYLQMVELSVNGEPVPRDQIKSVHTKGDLEGFSDHPEVKEWMAGLDSFKVEDGMLILRSKAHDSREVEVPQGNP